MALGWSEGRNLQIDIRWGASNLVLASSAAKELVALQPEVILSNTTPVTAALQLATNTIPMVFVVVSDPVGSKFVKNIARPEANITGFMNVEPLLVQKWLEFLMELTPSPTRVAVRFNPETAPYAKFYLQHLESAASKLGVKTVSQPIRSENEINEANRSTWARTGQWPHRHDRCVHDCTSQIGYPGDDATQSAVDVFFQ